MINRIILPRLGSKKVAAVQSRDIHSLHVAMKENTRRSCWSALEDVWLQSGNGGATTQSRALNDFKERRERWLSLSAS